MGLGEGVLFPCLHQLSGAWFPIQERSRLVAMVASGNDLGTIAALVLSPAIMDSWGWQYIFVVFAVLSGVWVLVFAVVGASTPESDRSISPNELEFIVQCRGGGGGSTPVPVTPAIPASSPTPYHIISDDTRPARGSWGMQWRILLGSRAAWAIYIAHFCNNYSWYVLLSWIPQYFEEVLDINLGKKGYSAAIPYICGYVSVVIVGWVGDRLIARGMRVLRVRQVMNAFAFTGSALALMLLQWVPSSSPTMAVFLLSLAMFCGRAGVGGFIVNMIDIAPHNAGHVMGISNTIATIPGILGNVVTGAILEQTGNWSLVFGIASAVSLVGGLAFQLLASDKPIYAKMPNSGLQ